MRKPQIHLLAMSPFVLGYLLDRAMMKLGWHGAIITLFSALFYLYWFFAGRLSAKWTKSKTESILAGNSFAIVSFALVMFQLAQGQFSSGVLGVGPQMFFLPAIVMAARVQNMLMFFTPVRTLWSLYIIAFVLVLAVHHAGFLHARRTSPTV
jgi:hypothetical protein